MDELSKVDLISYGNARKHISGYLRITIRGNKRDNRVLEHRLVWEQHNNACLLSWGIIHHINGDKQDNRIENLEITNHKTHPSKHKKDMSDRRCLICGGISQTYYRNSQVWRRHLITGEKWVCPNCHDKLRPPRKHKR